jgi:hypothetical protein
MKLRCCHSLILFVLAVANSGCLSPETDSRPATPPTISSLPSVAPTKEDLEHPGSDLLLFRAASLEEADPVPAAIPPPGRVGLPDDLQTLPLNPVFDLLMGNGTAQSTQDAYGTLGLLSLTGMTHILRGVSGGSGSGGRHSLRHVADFTDDALQPDDETPRAKRPPFMFGLEWKY